MIVHEVGQGSAAWHALRLGIPTASCMDRIIASSRSWYVVDGAEDISRHTRQDTAAKALLSRQKKGGDGTVISRFDPSAQQEKYLDHLLAEWALGSPIDTYQSREMERGQDLEEEARAWYELHTDTSVELGGFITDDAGTMGCSPDFRVYEDDALIGGGEIKCPLAQTHMGYARGTSSVLDTYKHQIQACLLITGARWWDVVSYFPHPRMPPVVLRVAPEADADYRAALASALEAFTYRLESEKVRMAAAGYGPRT